MQSSNQIGVLELILTDEQGVSYANSGFENTDYTLVTLHPQRPTPLKFSEETSLPPPPPTPLEKLLHRRKRLEVII